MKKTLLSTIAVLFLITGCDTIPKLENGQEVIAEIDGKSFTNLGGTVSGDILSTNEAGGFTGAMIGLYATSVGN